MEDLLTTRQLQELLQVDRITIYRMLDDGRLPGFKVGGQWRFSQQEIDAWLREQRAGLGLADLSAESLATSAPAHVLPLSCVQAIQSIYAEALDVAAVTTRPDGTPLTEISNSCEFCNLILATEEGRRSCAASWQPSQTGRPSAPAVHTCHVGLLCVAVPIVVGEQWVANVAGCQFAVADGEGWMANLPVLASEVGLDEDDLREAADSVRLVPSEQPPHVARLLQKVADTFAEIGQERQSLIGRLERIAEITKV